jgi:hypothetical protein
MARPSSSVGSSAIAAQRYPSRLRDTLWSPSCVLGGAAGRDDGVALVVDGEMSRHHRAQPAHLHLHRRPGHPPTGL